MADNIPEWSSRIEVKNTIVRSKFLGNSYTEEQKAAIADGSFKGLFLGDYWKINGVVWRIVDINYWLNTGDINPPSNHLVIMPDHYLYAAKMNDTNTTEGGYANSKMRTSGLDQAKEMIFNAFGEENVLKHREYLIDGVTNGYPSSGSWYDSTVELPNEPMMLGSYVFVPIGDGSFFTNLSTIDKTQLALMTSQSIFINRRYTYWLRDVVSASSFSYINLYGIIDVYKATSNYNVRPVFGLTGGAA